MIRGAGHSIAFHIDGMCESQDFQAGGREGIWWLPSNSASDYLILTNHGTNLLPLDLTLFDASGKASTQKMTLAPRAANRLSVRQLLAAAGLTGSYGGIKISAATHASSLDTLHVLFDQKAGFSAVMKMFDYNPSAQIKERDYAKTGVWTLRAPMLALSNPDPALAFPVGTTLHPQLFVRNTAPKPVNAALVFNWRSDSTTGKSPALPLHLNPFETRCVDVAALQDGKTLPQSARWTSVMLTTNSNPDEVMAVAASYDATLQYGAQTPFTDQLARHWVGSMWEYDALHDSVITVGNGGTKPTQAAFTIFYNQGTQKYELEQTLQSDEQMWIDIGKLIRQSVPDKNGKALPADLTSGSYEIWDLTNKGVGTLFEGKVIYDKTYGHVTYGCGECCGYKTISPWWAPLGVPFQGTAGQGVNGLDSCSRTWQDISGDFYGNWSTANTSVATVDFYGTHTGVAVGSTTSSSWGEDQGYINNWHCPAETFYPGGGANVINVSQSPTILNMSSGDTGKGITVSVSPSSFASAVTFAQGSVINYNSSSTAGFTYNKPGSFTGNDLWAISIDGTNSPSGTQNSQACTSGVCASPLSNVAVPPQILIQMIQAEAQGTNSTTMTAVAEVARNRFGSTIFGQPPPYTTYQNTIISGQFATTSTTTGIEPELDIASSVFTGTSAGTFCGALSFWTPTASQWQTVQTALQSGTTTFPSGTGAPTYSSWPTSQQQILFVSAIGTNSSGVPYFLFLTQRNSTQPAAVNASCN